MPTIKPGEKLVIFASTGSGKTVFIRTMLLGLTYTIVYDAKHEFSWSETGKSKYDDIYYSLADLKEWRGPSPAIYRPDIAEVRDGGNRFFEYAWKLKTPRVYVDELHDICSTGHAGFWLLKCIKQGRSRGLSIWYGSQRPSKIPQEILSESKHFLIGQLLLPQDRKKIEEVTGLSASITVPKYEFWYVGTDNRTPRKYNARDIVVKG